MIIIYQCYFLQWITKILNHFMWHPQTSVNACMNFLFLVFFLKTFDHGCSCWVFNQHLDYEAQMEYQIVDPVEVENGWVIVDQFDGYFWDASYNVELYLMLCHICSMWCCICELPCVVQDFPRYEILCHKHHKRKYLCPLHSQHWYAQDFARNLE